MTLHLVKVKTIYLAGPMADCDDVEATLWRSLVIARLSPYYRIHNPMIRDFRVGYVQREHEALIVEGDKQDIENSDIVLVNPWKVSVGTSMEIIHAWNLRKQVLVIKPDDGRLSPWVTYHAHEIFKNVETAIQYLEREGKKR